MSRNEVFGELGRSRGMSRPPSSPPHWGAGASRWVDGLLDEKREKETIINWLICLIILIHTGGVVHEQESKEMRQVIACSPNVMNIR